MKWVLFPLITISIVIILASSYIISQNDHYQGKIYPHVWVNNLDFGAKPKKDVEDYFLRLNRKFGPATFTLLYQNQPIATFSGTQLNLGYDAKGAADRAYLIGRTDHATSRLYQKLATLLGWQNFKFSLGLNYDKSLLREFINESKDKYDKPAKNALFKFENGRVLSFREEEKGQEIEDEVILADFDKLVSEIEQKIVDKKLNLSVKIIEPEVTLANSNEFGIEELIAEGKSDYSHSIPERIHNIVLASSKFNGVLIPKGEVFSFNDTIGDISSLTGYQPAYIIKSGKTVLGDGGGVCQVSTTLFRAALNAGLPIIERTAHAYRVGYYENDSKPGFDATVFAPFPDLKIQNDTPGSILVQTEVDEQNNLLYFRFYGRKDNRKVEISPVTVYGVVPPLPEIRQDDPTLKKGVVKQVDFPAWGAKAVFDYKVTNDNKTTFEKKFLSVYRPWQAVYLVGQAD